MDGSLPGPGSRRPQRVALTAAPSPDANPDAAAAGWVRARPGAGLRHRHRVGGVGGSMGAFAE